MSPPHCLITFVESVNDNEALFEVLTDMQQCELEIFDLRLSILPPEFSVELNQWYRKYRLMRSNLSQKARNHFLWRLTFLVLIVKVYEG